MVYAEIVQKIVPLVGSKRFHRVLSKVKVISAVDGQCDVEMKVEEGDTNAHGTLHGGLSATLVDVISTFALLTHPKIVNTLTTANPNVGVSVDFHLSFLKAAHIGDEILVQGNTIRAGSKLAFLEATIRNKKTNDILVKGTQTKYIGNK